MIFRELTSQEFEKFTKSYNLSSIYQSVEYGRAMNKQNNDVMFVGLVDEDNNVIAASLIIIEKVGHFKKAIAPRGFLIDYCNQNLVEKFTNGIKKFLSKKNIIAIKINPLIIRNTYDIKYGVINKNNYYDNIYEHLKSLGYYHLGYNEKFEAIKPRYEAILDLDKPYYILFKNFTKQFRTKIRNAENNGIKIYKGSKEQLEYLYLHTQRKYPRDLEYFKTLYEEFAKTNNVEFFYSKLDTDIYLKRIQQKYIKQEEICADINNEVINNVGNNNKIISQKMTQDKLLEQYKKDLVFATKLLRDNPEGIILASSLFIRNNDEIYLIMDGYNLKYKRFNAKHLLLWKLCERYSKSGFKKLNFGGIASITNTPEEYKGLNEFKLSFNAQAIEYLGDLELITNNTLYFMYQNDPIRHILKK